MRPIPIIIAAAVIATLYALVFERDRVRAFAGASAVPEAAVEGAEADAARQDAAAGDGSIGEAPRRVAVIAQHSEARVVESAVILRGRTEAARAVTVMAETAGRVVSEPLRRGTAVAAGDTLCAIDPGTRGAALAEARARLPEAQARLAEAEARKVEADIGNRAARSLSEGGFASETRVASAAAAVEAAAAAVETARAGLEAARAGVAAAETEIARLTIVAPFDGILETDTAELGALLQPGVPCADVIRLDPIRLVGHVAETEIGRIVEGARAGARLASGREILGEVTFVSRAADEATRTFRVEARVPNGDLSVRDGETAEIAIEAEGEPAHLLPASALTLDDEGALGVRHVVGGHAAFAPVTILRDTVRGVWVTGLPDVAEVIVVGQEYVRDGVAVDVTLREAAP